VENLLKDDAATKKQLDDLNAQIEILRKQYNSLQMSLSITSKVACRVRHCPFRQQVEQLQDQIKKSVIVNPIDGTVL